MSRILTGAAFLAIGCSVLGCSILRGPGEPTRIWEYRTVDDRTISVLSDTGAGYETWVASVVETPAAVTVEVRTRMTDAIGGGGVSAGEPIWFTISLTAPLGDRDVLDAVTNTPVKRAAE